MPIEDEDTAGADVAPDVERPSRSQLRRIALAATRLGADLVKFSPGELQRLDLDPDLRQAVEACRGFKKKARARQLKLIGGMLRERDVESIRAAIQGIHQTKRGE
jgi:ribosomal 50S subunit-associated protein YjgA (DUF615 family)